jgi:hypothetical protein
MHLLMNQEQNYRIKAILVEKKTYSLPDSHYYKYGHSLVKKVSFEDSDRDILNMLEEIFLTNYACIYSSNRA